MEGLPLWAQVLGAILGMPGAGAMGAWLALRSQARKAAADAEVVSRTVDAHVAEEDASAIDTLRKTIAGLSSRVAELENSLAEERAARMELRYELEECKRQAGLGIE